MGERQSTLLNPKTSAIKLDYIISTDVLGLGVSGKVYKIKGISDKKYYALKVLRDNSRSRRELDIHARVSENCKHIVGIKDIYENKFRGENSLLVVLEYMEGGELFHSIQERCRTSQFTEREAVLIVIQICNAIHHLHNLNIAHRDLKPENLLFSSSDASTAVLKLTDFGFAKEVADSNSNTLKTPCYTPYYVAPEVLGPEKYNKSCDMWSLGVITYILLCGYPPFYANNGQAMSPGMKRRIRRGQYSYPEDEWAMVSNEAKDLISSLLNTNPEKRLTIEQIMQHPWLCKYAAVPPTPLATGKVLMEEQATWQDFQHEFETALRQMRVDTEETIQLKNVSDSHNGLLDKRKKKRKSLSNVAAINTSVANNNLNSTTNLVNPSCPTIVEDPFSETSGQLEDQVQQFFQSN